MDRFTFLIFSLLSAQQALAFPEMVRHGYNNCTACHISPSGGAALSPYGHELAKELLAYKWKKSDTNAVGAKQSETPAMPAWRFGGEARFLQFHRENDFETTEKFIPMQMQGDAVYDGKEWAFVTRLGLTGKGGEGGVGFQFPTVYALYRFHDQWSLRAGQFLPNFGLNNSSHFLGTRGRLGFGFDDQRPGLEVAWLGEKFAAFLSGFGPRVGNLGASAATVQLQYSPTDKSKVAFNYWQETDYRKILGAWFVSPIYGPLFVSGDFNRSWEDQFKVYGCYHYLKLGYDIRQGLNAMLIYDHSQRDHDRNYTVITRVGPGLQFYPSEHFEIEASWLKEENKLDSEKQGDFAYVLLHAFY